MTRYQLLYADWRGYVLSLFSLVWIANGYMSLFGRLRLDIREERLEIEQLEAENLELKEPRQAGWRK